MNALAEGGWHLVAKHRDEPVAVYSRADGAFVKVTTNPDGSTSAVAIPAWQVASMHGWATWQFVDVDWHSLPV